jgi:predicted lipoprotein with Yx(FWY)xxD motif
MARLWGVMRVTILVALVLVGGGLASGFALGAGAEGEPSRPAAIPITSPPAAAAPAAARASTAVTVRRSRYGRILFDGRGRALYLFTRERSRTPRCYGACAEAWPPFISKRGVSAGKGATRSFVGTVRRRTGARQVTYRGHPLYYYVGDRRPGQILCQNVVEFGGTWLVVSPSGRPVR